MPATATSTKPFQENAPDGKPDPSSLCASGTVPEDQGRHPGYGTAITKSARAENLDGQVPTGIVGTSARLWGQATDVEELTGDCLEAADFDTLYDRVDEAES